MDEKNKMKRKEGFKEYSQNTDNREKQQLTRKPLSRFGVQYPNHEESDDSDQDFDNNEMPICRPSHGFSAAYQNPEELDDFDQDADDNDLLTHRPLHRFDTLYPNLEELYVSDEDAENYEKIEDNRSLFGNKYAPYIKKTELNARGKQSWKNDPLNKKSKKISKPHQDGKDIQSRGLFFNVIVPIFIVLGACISFYYCFTLQQPAISNTTLDINAIVSSLKAEFEGQPKMSFKIIRNALKAVGKPEPTAPAILLLLADKDAEELSHQLAQKLAKAISPHHLNISGSEYIKQDTNVGKKKIDDLLLTLSEERYNAVLVENLHLIPGGTALMFHTYCDHENAPFKRAVFVMTVAAGHKIQKDLNGKEWDQTAMIRLSQSWQDIDEDQMKPLLARLTVGVVVVTRNT